MRNEPGLIIWSFVCFFSFFLLCLQSQPTEARKYEEITIGWPIAAAKAFASLSGQFKFIYVSGGGASTNPTFLTPFYGRIKGAAESALLSLSRDPLYRSLKPYSVRAGAVDESAHSEIHAFIPKKEGFIKKLEAGLLPTVRALYPPIICPTRELGAVLVELAVGDGEPLDGKGVEGEGRTLENEVIRRLGGL